MTSTRIAAIAFIILAITSPVVPGADNTPANVEPKDLNKSIDQTINKREYTWRMPRESKAKDSVAGKESTFWQRMDEYVSKALDKIHGWLVAAAKWLKKHLRNYSRSPSSTSQDLNWTASMEAVLMILIALVASILAIMLYRLWRRRAAKPPSVEAQAVATITDLSNENIPADKFAADEWMTLASELIAKGEYRLAIRAMFLACLTGLARHEQVTIRRCKSNREYQRELARKAHDTPPRLEAFSKNLTVLEQNLVRPPSSLASDRK